ncbi:MAG: hypothetical protein M1813_008100 [Trichoglossum hirsutum]|nr:MAG: hypothetical protein M1813_008100 [Trichoglossum hirsutum]
MSTEPTLPPLLPPTSSTNSFSRPPRKRTYKRTYSPSTSSDPPLFSSDDHLFSGAENYTDEGRQRKKVFRGAWWDRSCGDNVERVGERRTLRRVMDSGVWMGSEGTEGEGEEEDVGGESYNGVEEGVDGKSVHDEGVVEDPVGKTRVVPVVVPVMVLDGPLTEAERIVQRCLEEGNERVNLSDLLLTSLSPSLLQPLALLTKSPPSVHYHPLTPALHLYLSHNSLRSLPPTLFNLTTLTVLSLRNNKLTSLPDTIGHLRNLVELNVAGNRLRWLPWGVVRLLTGEGNLDVLSVWPNPFLEPEGSVVGGEGGEGISQGLPIANSPRTWTPTVLNPPPAWVPTFLTSTPLTYLLPTGTSHPSSPPHPSSTPLTTTHLPTGPTLPPPYPSPTGPPTLLELSLLKTLRAYGSDPDFDTLPSLLPSGSVPQRLLREAADARDEGGRHCTVCGREYVVPRTEWVEWWDCVPGGGGKGVPVLKRGCRWSCIDPPLGGFSCRLVA